MKKSAQVVMLPTNEKAKFGDLILTPTYPQKLLIFEHQKCTEVSQHLYFLSDEEIKEGDWVYDVCDGIVKVEHEYQLSYIMVFKIDCKKIIATTDRSLMWHDKTPIGENVNGLWTILPQPSQSFIDKFVEEYNKGNVITEVMVEWEYNSYSTKTNGELTADLKLKINPDNTIDINMPKDSWNRDEVMKFGNWCRIHDSKFPNQVWTIQQLFDKWIEENL